MYSDLLRPCEVHIKRVKVCDGCIHVAPKNTIRGMVRWIRRITKEVENTAQLPVLMTVMVAQYLVLLGIASWVRTIARPIQ